MDITYVVAPTVSMCQSEQRTGGGWDGGDDHGDELCGGSDGEVWSHGSDQRGGGEQHIDHGHNAGGCAGAVTVTVTVNGQSGSLTNGFTYNADGSDRFCAGGISDAAITDGDGSGDLSGEHRRRET